MAVFLVLVPSSFLTLLAAVPHGPAFTTQPGSLAWATCRAPLKQICRSPSTVYDEPGIGGGIRAPLNCRSNFFDEGFLDVDRVAAIVIEGDEPLSNPGVLNILELERLAHRVVI